MFYNNLKKYTGFYLSVKCAVESMVDKKLSEAAYRNGFQLSFKDKYD